MAATGLGNVQLPPNNVGQRTRAIASSKRKMSTRQIERHKHGIIRAGFWYYDSHIEIQWRSGYIVRYENVTPNQFETAMKLAHPASWFNVNGIGAWGQWGLERAFQPRDAQLGTRISDFTANPNLKFGNW
jgi:hypothetical protein